MEKTLRATISDTMNETDKLYRLAEKPEDIRRLGTLRYVLLIMFREIIRQKIANNTPEFEASISALENATKEAKAAQKDIQKVTRAIKITTEAAKVVDKILKLGLKFVSV